jgi:hypothetical protein
MQALLQEFINFIGNLHGIPVELTHSSLENIRKFYLEMTDPQMLGFAFYKMAEQVMKSKVIPENMLWFIDQCIYDIIEKSIQS